MFLIEEDFFHKGFRCVVAQVGWDKAPHHRVGYVGLRPNHPLWGVSYNQDIPSSSKLLSKLDSAIVGEDVGFIPAFCFDPEASKEAIEPQYFLFVHGGLTFSDSGSYPITSIANLWWFGFDAAHCDDTEELGKPRSFMKSECVRLADQLFDLKSAL